MECRVPQLSTRRGKLHVTDAAEEADVAENCLLPQSLSEPNL
jgi:hypothetical protein